MLARITFCIKFLLVFALDDMADELVVFEPVVLKLVRVDVEASEYVEFEARMLLQLDDKGKSNKFISL